jgi:hypothetical protein
LLLAQEGVLLLGLLQPATGLWLLLQIQVRRIQFPVPRDLDRLLIRVIRVGLPAPEGVLLRQSDTDGCVLRDRKYSAEFCAEYVCCDRGDA